MSRALADLDDAEFGRAVAEQGGAPFQARQLSHWVFKHGARDWDSCRNVPAPLKDRLAESFALRRSGVAAVDRAADGTQKLLIELGDGETVETVIIPDGGRQTLCVSTQVGCPVGCVFCASGLDGVRRNLSAGEIVEQVLHARDLLAGHAAGPWLTNLVVMGMGEPLLNLENLVRALQRIHDPDGINLGARRITVSTSGYPESIARFAKLTPHAYGLAVSLHAADDRLRRELVPTARATVAEIVGAARRYAARKGRPVTFEIVLLAGVNDRPGDARRLAGVLRDLPCTVNLIAWNPVDRIGGLGRPSDRQVEAFADALRAGRLQVTVRRARGADRSAACGQLRIRELQR